MYIYYFLRERPKRNKNENENNSIMPKESAVNFFLSAQQLPLLMNHRFWSHYLISVTIGVVFESHRMCPSSPLNTHNFVFVHNL